MSSLSRPRHAAAAANTTQLFVRSNIHMANLDKAVKKHLHLQKFVDVTLSCEGRKFKCHRLILAAASPLFENLFLDDNPVQHPIVIIPFGIKAWTLQALIEFMYKGHVNVSQCGLQDLVRSAELLRITGLENARKDYGMYCYDNNSTSNGHSTRSNWTYPDNGNGIHTERAAHNSSRLQPAMYGYNDRELYDDKNNNSNSNNNYNSSNNNNNNNNNNDIDVGENADVEPVNHNDVDNDDDGADDETDDVDPIYHNGVDNEYVGVDDDNVYVDSTPNTGHSKPLEAPHLGNARKYEYQDVVQSRGKCRVRINPSECGDDDDLADDKVANITQETSLTTPCRRLNNIDKNQRKPIGKIRVKSSEMLLKHNETADDDEVSTVSANGGILITDIQSFKREVDDVEVEEDVDLGVENIICHPNVSYICPSSSPSYSSSKFAKNPAYENSINNYDDMKEAAARNTSPIQTSPKGGTALYNGHEIKPVETEKPRQEQQELRNQQQQQLKVKVYKKQLYDHFRRQFQFTNSNISTIAAGAVTEAKLKPNQFHALTPTFKSSTITQQQEQQQRIMLISEPSVETVVLRSPRSNQPRNYSTQALYNALMAVKHGESIYRASREHHVPRKTLRNWMKRWNIKSQFPMPKQLKDAAIRKKINESINLHNY